MDDFLKGLNAFSEEGNLHAIVVAIILLAATTIIAHLATRLITRVVSSDGVPLPSSSILINIARVVIWCIGIGLVLSVCFDIDVNALIAALGVGGIALSLGLQDTIKNLIGGLQVTLMGIVHPDDHIIVGSTEGIVQDVNWRQTVLKDYENVVHIIPNSVISSTEVSKIDPQFMVTSILVLNNDGRDIDEMIAEMEAKAKAAIEAVAPLERFVGILVTQIGEYGIWAKMRFVLADVTHAREARDAALRAIAPYTRNSSQDMLPAAHKEDPAPAQAEGLPAAEEA